MLSVVGQLGKVLFLGNSVGLASLRKAANAETDYREQVSKLFYRNISTAYMDVIKHSVIPKIGLDFDSVKEHYHLKVTSIELLPLLLTKGSGRLDSAGIAN